MSGKTFSKRRKLGIFVERNKKKMQFLLLTLHRIGTWSLLKLCNALIGINRYYVSKAYSALFAQSLFVAALGN